MLSNLPPDTPVWLLVGILAIRELWRLLSPHASRWLKKTDEIADAATDARIKEFQINQQRQEAEISGIRAQNKHIENLYTNQDRLTNALIEMSQNRVKETAAFMASLDDNSDQIAALRGTMHTGFRDMGRKLDALPTRLSSSLSANEDSTYGKPDPDLDSDPEPSTIA